MKSILQLILADRSRAHLMGGGFWENIPRVLPQNTKAVIDESSAGNGLRSSTGYKKKATSVVEYRTFNCGVGYGNFITRKRFETVLHCLNKRAKSVGYRQNWTSWRRRSTGWGFNKIINLNSALLADFYQEENEKLSSLFLVKEQIYKLIDACHLGRYSIKLLGGK